jgi:hypothetical protein
MQSENLSNVPAVHKEPKFAAKDASFHGAIRDFHGQKHLSKLKYDRNSQHSMFSDTKAFEITAVSD